MEPARLRLGEIVAAAGGVALLLVMFLNWYAVGAAIEGTPVSISIGLSAWEAFDYTDLLLALVALTAITLAALTATQRSPALPVTASVITTLAGALATLLLLYRIANQPGPNEFVSVEIGAWLGLLCVLAITAGGWLAMRDESMQQAPVPVETRPAPSAGADPPPAGSEPPPASAANPGPRPGPGDPLTPPLPGEPSPRPPGAPPPAPPAPSEPPPPAPPPRA